MAELRILDEGVSALVNAQANGTHVDIDSWIIGDAAGFNIDTSYSNAIGTDVDTGTASEISVVVINDDTLMFVLTLDESRGNYNVGNIVLYDSNNNAFAMLVLDSAVSKFYNDLPQTVGNRLAFNMSVTYNNVSNLINTTILQQNLANMPIVSDDSALQEASGAPYNAYIIQNHRHTGLPCIAIRRNVDNRWFSVPIFDYTKDGNFGLLDGGVDGNNGLLNVDYVVGGGFLADFQEFNTIDGGDLNDTFTTTIDGGSL